MPREPNGGKPGRPTKAEKPFFSGPQLIIIEAIVENPKYKRKLLATRAKVSPSAVSQALHNPVVEREIVRRITNPANQKLSDISERKDIIRNRPQTKFKEMIDISTHKKEALFYEYASKNFKKKFQLAGSDIWIDTAHDYVKYLIENNLWPAQVIDQMRKEALRKT